MPQPRDVGPEFYTEEYYQHACHGHEVFQRSGGRELEPIRHQALLLADPKPGDRILDLGCGRGELLVACALRGCDAHGIDYSPAAVRIAREVVDQMPEIAGRVGVEHMDLRKLSLLPSRFDVAFIMDVVEHIPQPELLEVMRAIREVLRPGGSLIAHTGPTGNFLRVGQHVKRILYRMQGKEVPPRSTRTRELRYAGHCNFHSRRSLTQALACFEDVRVWYQFTQAGGLLHRMAARAGLVPLLAYNLWGVARRRGGVRER